MTFDAFNLNTPLRKALADLGFTHPTTIQQKAFAPVMSGQDVCGIAQTGTGKTLAYLLPCLRQLTYARDRFAQMLIIVPTRELVIQVVAQVKELSAHMPLVVVGAYGGVNMNPQAAAVEAGLDIMVATPGRLLDLVLNGSLRLKAIKKLVIDEVDEMLDLGFRTQLTRILELLPPRRQNLMFSATMTPEVEVLIDTFFNAPIRVEAAPAGTPLENIDQTGYQVPNFFTKIDLLEHLLLKDEAMTKVLVFVSTKHLADEVGSRLEDAFPEAFGVMHAGKAQNIRFRTVNQFRDGQYRFIIATDLIARGIDISEVTHVVNFDLPEEPESYIHRIGRTGRADKKGIAVSFIAPGEQEALGRIEDLMQYRIPLLPLPEEVVVTEALAEWEKPKVRMKTIQVKLPKIEAAGAAFHEKSLKNRKVNRKVSHADKMMQKYGKPKKRSGKK